MVKTEILRLLESSRKPLKFQLVLLCVFERIDRATGEAQTISHYINSGHNAEVYPVTNISEKYDTLCAIIEKKFSEFQKKGSGWRLRNIPLPDPLELEIPELPNHGSFAVPVKCQLPVMSYSDKMRLHRSKVWLTCLRLTI
jgi:hypothetical protein